MTNNDQLLRTLARAEKLGKTSVALLIQGEPGTGKKLLAQIIRQLSPRHNRPMLEVICAGDMDLLEDDLFGHRKGAFPGAEDHRLGFFRKVDEGTLLLQEIGQLSMEIQTRLIQTARGKAVRPLGDDLSYPIDVRIIATTSQSLHERVSRGQFREDLYHYFSVFPLYLPPLRDRKEDLPLLVNHFFAKYNPIHNKIVEKASDAALNLLVQHQWPGNILELEKVIERAIAEVNPGEKELSVENITFEEADLNRGLSDPGMLNYLLALMDDTRELPAYQPFREKVLAEIQRLYCVRLLRVHQGNVKNASVDAGLKVETFKKMLSELMIDPEHYQY
jgi:DNA-binding NtrC family response regulator